MTAADFADYDRRNPGIWREFVRIAMRCIHRGMDHWSADAVLHVVRYETAMDGRDNGDIYKCNNSATCWYSRKFAARYPQYADFFETRRSVADERPRVGQLALFG